MKKVPVLQHVIVSGICLLVMSVAAGCSGSDLATKNKVLAASNKEDTTLENQVLTEIQPSKSNPVLGLWMREGDEHANMVVHVKANKKGEIFGDLVYVPEYSGKWTFAIGNTKMKDFEETSASDHEYTCKVSWKQRGTAWNDVDGYYYTDEIVTTWHVYTVRVSDTKMFLRSKEDGSQLQKWNRVNRDASDMSYVYYGKGKYAAGYEEFDKTAAYFRLAAQHVPEEDAYFCNNLAWSLATSEHEQIRNPEEAIRIAKYACKIDASANNLDTLAAAYAACGDYHNAVKYQRQAVGKLPPELNAIGTLFATMAGRDYDIEAELKSRLAEYRKKLMVEDSDPTEAAPGDSF